VPGIEFGKSLTVAYRVGVLIGGLLRQNTLLQQRVNRLAGWHAERCLRIVELRALLIERDREIAVLEDERNNALWALDRSLDDNEGLSIAVGSIDDYREWLAARDD